MWEDGGYASKGLAQLAKGGSSRGLQEEMKAKRKHIRTIINARGLRHPNLNGKVFLKFQTDRTNHLLSMLSMLSPSPDWMVGVSMLEMCQTNCTWVDRKNVLLYPWDVGVDSGMSYQSEYSPTTPIQTIQRITSQHPQDENSPFYKPEGGPGKHLARIYIQKLREYKQEGGGYLPENTHELEF